MLQLLWARAGRALWQVLSVGLSVSIPVTFLLTHSGLDCWFPSLNRTDVGRKRTFFKGGEREGIAGPPQRKIDWEHLEDKAGNLGW